MNLNILPVYYHSNPKSWMNSLLFEEFLQHIDNKFRTQNKKILLLNNNTPLHFNPNSVEQDNNSDDDDEFNEYNNFGKEGSTTARLCGNFRKNYNKMSKLTHEEDTNQMIANNLYSDSYANLLANALNDFFYSLNEDIPTKDILNENNIINLIQAEMCNENDSPNHSDDSEEEPEFVLLSDASKSLHMWVTFFEQQQSDKFKKEDINIFKNYLKIVKRLEF
ncbi:21339_t:CDS:2 [Dentiscutata erythropus]|uniref:21339_t:CDS:1 n=1 Tax=Dentiscutata erythropus TaxID=1348616 RepID=A0A9N8ZFK9_9GLOM|nr:21339_t:CDS:2 [Dentiscutata erythropus]